LGRELLPLPVASSIVIIERRVLIRECLATCLEERLETPVLAYSSIEEWRNDPAGSCVRVMILSGAGSHAGQEEESALLRELSAQRIPVVLFSDASHFRLGASRFGCDAETRQIPSDTPLDEVAETIRRVLSEEDVFAPHDFAPAPDEERPCPARLAFTARENDVVGALMTGKSNKVIAGELNISENSVKVHLRNVMRKLDVHNRTEAVIKIAKANHPHASI
jgi:DNA-binding NarL/FixJ family response regulator